jgi:hypothetical protein
MYCARNSIILVVMMVTVANVVAERARKKQGRNNCRRWKAKVVATKTVAVAEASVVDDFADFALDKTEQSGNRNNPNLSNAQLR